MAVDRDLSKRHRADYILERGTWRATCRLCGWQASDGNRRQASTYFRGHIRDSNELAQLAERSRALQAEGTGA